MLILLFVANCYCQINLFDISIFGGPGTDTVEIDYVNGFGILNPSLPKPKQAPNISEAHYSDYINPDDYPWPGHPMTGTCTWDQLQKETNKIVTFYARDNLTQDEMYRHPAALPQYYGTYEQIDNAPRVQIRYTLTPKYNRHYIPAFIPPGEIVTIEIPEAMQGKLSIIFNENFKTIPDQNGKPQMDTRLPQLEFVVTLTQKVNTVGSPYGGNLCFAYDGDVPIEINITNVVLQPYFVYGQTSDEEWINDISKWPGPYAWLETGNMIHVVPAYIVRDVTRLSDSMKWWRSAYQIAQTTAKDPYNPRNARVTNILEMFYEQFIFIGGAVAIVGSNICFLPVDWINTVVRYDSLMDNPWGIVHEMDHHHQDDWGLAQPEHSEMTNNAISLLIYALTNEASSPRNTNPNGHGLYDWAQYAIGTIRLNENASMGTGLARYSTMLHVFGPIKFKIFVSSDQEDKWYPRKQYGDAGAEMLRASKVFNRNMRYHYNFYGSSDDVLNQSGAFIELEKMKLKPFHPVLNTYAVGSIIDGKRVISVRPYVIPSAPTEINFVSQMVYRTNCEKNLFGDFEYHGVHFEPGRSSFWKEIDTGVFIVTPKKEFTSIEEVIVDYLDKTTNEIHQVICQFKQTNHYNKVTIYNNLGDQNILTAYNKTVELGPNAINDTQTYTKLSYDGSNFKSSNGTILINDGMLKPNVSGSFVFTITQRFALFYLSFSPLKGNPDDDAPYLINYNKIWELPSSSDPIELNSSTIYYYRLVNFEYVSSFNTAVQYSVNGTNCNNIPENWIAGENIPDEVIWKSQYEPDFEPIYQMDQWNGENFLKNSQSQWDVYQFPGGGSVYLNGGTLINKTITEAITDSNPSTEYRCLCAPIGYLAPFPHIYEIDMGFIQTFPTIKITMAEKEVNMPFDGYLEIRVAESNNTDSNSKSLNNDNSIVFLGHVNNSLECIDLEKPATGRYLRITFINNSRQCTQYPYVGEWESRSAISTLEVGRKINSQKVYPMTGTKYFTRKNQWTETRNGIYYNGKGFTGSAGSILDISIPEEWDEIGIIGDYYPTMGRADVFVDGEKVGTIGESIYNEQIINRKLQYASRAYESIVFYEFFKNINRPHTIEIKVIDGNVTLTGIIVPQNVKTSIPSATFTPSNPFTASYIFRPIISIKPTPEPIISVEPTLDPIENGPTTNEHFDLENSVIEFNKDGYTDGDKHVITNSVTDDIILIKTNHPAITMKTDSDKQEKDQFLSPEFEHAIIRIDSPQTKNGYGDGEFGIHANSKDPIIQMPSAETPLNIFNNENSVLTLTVKDQVQTSKKLLDNSNFRFNKVEISKGNLSLRSLEDINEILFENGIFYVSGEMKAENNNTFYPIELVFDELKLNRKSKSSIRKLKITKELNIKQNANLAIKDSADFTESPVIDLSELSYIYFGNSQIAGIPKEINYELNSPSTLESKESPLICGARFDCSSWLEHYNGNKQYPEAECKANSNGEICLYPVAKDTHSSKKTNVGLIVGVVWGVIAAIVIAVVVTLVVIKKKAEKELASDKSSPLEEFETHPHTNEEPETAEEKDSITL